MVVRNFVMISRLMPLRDTSYEYTDKRLILAFIERWHKETNTFHLPVGEMIVTLGFNFIYWRYH